MQVLNSRDRTRMNFTSIKYRILSPLISTVSFQICFSFSELLFKDGPLNAFRIWWDSGGQLTSGQYPSLSTESTSWRRPAWAMLCRQHVVKAKSPLCSTCFTCEIAFQPQDIRVSWNKVAVIVHIAKGKENDLYSTNETLSH